MNSFETLSVAERLAFTLDGLCKAVAARIVPGMAGWVMRPVIIMLVWTRIRRVEGRIQRLLVRFRAGRLFVRRSVPGVGRKGVGGAGVPARGLPRRFAWLLPMVPYEAANFSSQLRCILGEAEMVGLLRASAQARRILAPLCQMLGIEAAVLAPAGEEAEAGPEVAPARSAPKAEPSEPLPLSHHVKGAGDRSLDLLPAPFT